MIDFTYVVVKAGQEKESPEFNWPAGNHPSTWTTWTMSVAISEDGVVGCRPHIGLNNAALLVNLLGVKSGLAPGLV